MALLVFHRLPVCRQKPNVQFVRLAFTLSDNVLRLGEVAGYGKINYQLKNKYDAK
jgi:hypothetical protein